PDSFSGDGVWGDVGAAVDYAVKLADEGADVIDVGGESSRPFAEPVSVDEELQRVVPVIKKISRRLTIPISIDTYKPEVAQEAVEAGASMVNDINALRTEGMAEVVSRYDIPVVLMHMQGTPRDMQGNPRYDDVVGEIMAFLKKQAAFALKHDISGDKIILDPGIGFGKTTEHNLEIIRRLREFRSLGFPILIGTSRKSFIGNILDLPQGERLEGTMASVAAGILNGADIVRVHDVRGNVRVARMIDCLK
ncbi:MAG: dihydropteroate synthase, partial [Candidatus Altiarchaeales archaeon]|nr:dihydropteroate synthase [Candidatus Altiarchaeales archaeon]